MAWANPFTAIARIESALAENRRILMSNQAKLNAISTQLGVISGTFTKGLGEVTNRIEQLKGQAPESLDFAPLERVVTQLEVASQALDSLVPDEIDAEDPTAPEDGTDPETPAVPAEPETPVESTPGDDTTAPEQPAEAETPVTEPTPEAATDTDTETPAAEEEATVSTASSRRGRRA